MHDNGECHSSSCDLESHEQPENDQRDCKGSTMAMSVCDGGGTHHLGMLKPTVH